ncbi:MAG TPA: alkaline phosphatase family protein [Bryobacteraceae bacterium]|jgi:phospholipase C|nr:alkaline phosphatase family protein [Bryobacteraceae bacterium]
MYSNRRVFMKGLGGTCLGAAGSRYSRAFAQSASANSVPAPAESGIDHIVIVTMENRSFDHLLGWLPNANGIPNWLTYPDPSGARHLVYSLAPDYTGCSHPDPDHSYDGSRICYDGGTMQGFLLDTSNDVYCIGYYNASDIPFYAALAQTYTACDNWHAAILGPTFPNRMFIWAAQTDRLGDTFELSSLPTIFDALDAANISHRYYFNNVPYLALWGLKYVSSTALYANFLSDAATGNLPAVSFVDPRYTVLDDGTGNDDHPHADIRNGDAFLSQVYHALAAGPNWANTVLIVMFDEWGGFFEHVAPPRVVAPANSPDQDLVDGAALLGFRVPTVIASPFTKAIPGQPNPVDHALYDHTSALKLIEWRWGLPPLTARDSSGAIGNPATNFNFNSPDASVPALPMPHEVFARPCFSGLSGGLFDASNPASSGQQSRTQTQSATRQNEFAGLDKSTLVRDFVDHPHIQSLAKQSFK